MPDLETLAARMLLIGFDGFSPPPQVFSLISRGVGGVVLFRRNVESPVQVASLCATLKSYASRPLLICVDQEGGRVLRLREPFTPIPSMRILGQTNDEELAQAIGRILARELRAVNIDMDLAPVLDVDTNPDNPVIADRSFGADPALVSRMGCALLVGLQRAGVAACAKHFPGHGDTSQDSHLSLPRLPHPLSRLETIELPPFQAAVRSAVASIMTSHVIFEPLDHEYPATMSQPVLHGLLREKMNFDGLVISDDLEMKAIADHYPMEEVLVRGANAGVDLFAICHSHELQNQAIDLLASAARRGAVPASRLEQANRRLDRLASEYIRPAGQFAPDIIGCAEHQAILQRVQERVQTSPAGGYDPTEPVRR